MKRNFKKTLSIILAVLTLVSCFSIVGSAAYYEGHFLHLTTEYPEVKADGCNPGKTKSVYCNACSKWIIEESEIPAPHYPSDWTVVGTVVNCKNGFQMEKTCTKCKIVLETKTVNEHDYKTITVDQPNCEVAGTADKECKVCGDKVKQPVEPRLHSWGTDPNAGWVTRVVGTCTINGVETRTCTQCIKVEERVITAPGHKYVPVEGSGRLPTCREEGRVSDQVCTGCGDKLTGATISKKKHVDGDNDNYCDLCDLYVTDELPNGCDCPCHEKGGIRKLLFQIVIFFLSVFKVGATCGCGAVHYEVRF